MPKPRLCVVGACNMDLISYVPRLPKMGETLHGTQFQMGFGGKGANQAVMAAKLGGDVAMVSKVGKDSFGESTLANFHAWGIDTQHVLVTQEAFSGVAPIAVDAAGNNSIIIVVGANNCLTEEDIEAARPAIAGASVLICQLEIPEEITLAALRIAKEVGVTTILNPAPARHDLPAIFYELADILCPNEGESQLMTGHRVDTLPEAEAVGRHLLERGSGKVVLTLGERGSLLVSHDETVHVPATPVDALDTTGAGDAFVGSLAYFIASGQPLPEAMRRANHIAALSTQARGTQSSFPNISSLPAGWCQ